MEKGPGESDELKLASEQCGPGCDCAKPSGSKKMRMAVTLLVVLAACGVLAYKMAGAKTGPPAGKSAAFSAGIASQGTGAGSQVHGTDAGEQLDSLSSLNEKAADKNAVFICIPAPGDGAVKRKTVGAINAAMRNLKSNGIDAGMYTLKPGTPDYAKVTAKATPPEVIVISRGGSAVMVAGALTETNLMQAYVASTRSGGCCSSGNGSSKCN